MSRILIVDDEPSICWSLRSFLTDEGHEVEAAASVEAAERILDRFHPEAMMLDVRLPGEDGLTAMPRLQQRADQAPVIVMTAFGDLPTAVRAMQQGAFDYLVKPFGLEQAADAVSRAIAPAPAETSPPPIPRAESGEPIGVSPVMQRVFKQIALVAGTDVPVLITGETGTGKELVAQSVHRHSARRDGPFVPVCLAALNPAVIESELFGHVRGAFTGAAEERRGLFESAEGGTIFLDEIGETPLALQVKLLRVLESRQFAPVGSGLLRPTNVRVVAATNRSLSESILQGEFREDLYHRLRVFPIDVPPLRERPEDIPPLVEHFLRLAVGSRMPPLTTGFLAALRERGWPGNVRELRNAVECAAVLSRGGPLQAEHLPRPASTPQNVTSMTASRGLDAELVAWVGRAIQSADPGETGDLYRRFLQLVERPLLQTVLAHTHQNRTAAARLLGLDRATLRARLKAVLGADDTEPGGT